MPYQLLLLIWGLSYAEFSVIWGPLCLFDACSYFEAFLKQKAKLSVISRPRWSLTLAPIFRPLLRKRLNFQLFRGLYAGSTPALVANVSENSCLFAARGLTQVRPNVAIIWLPSSIAIILSFAKASPVRGLTLVHILDMLKSKCIYDVDMKSIHGIKTFLL